MLLNPETLKEYLELTSHNFLLMWPLLVFKSSSDDIETDPEVRSHEELLTYFDGVTGLNVGYAGRLKRLEAKVLTLSDGGESLGSIYVMHKEIASATEKVIGGWLAEIDRSMKFTRELKKKNWI